MTTERLDALLATPGLGRSSGSLHTPDQLEL